MKRSAGLRSVPTVFALISAAACGSDDSPATGPPRPTSVSVTPASATLNGLGDTLRLSAQVLDEEGAPMPGLLIRWSSGDPGVVLVDETGLVTARDGGPAVVTAHYLDLSGSADLFVDMGRTDVRITSADIDWACGDARISLENQGGPGEVRVEIWGVASGAGAEAPDSLLADASFQANTFWTGSATLEVGCDVAGRKLLVLSRDIREDSFRVTDLREP